MCAVVAAAPASVRPTLSVTSGLPARRSAVTAATKAGTSLIDSRTRPTAFVSGVLGEPAEVVLGRESDLAPGRDDLADRRPLQRARDEDRRRTGLADDGDVARPLDGQHALVGPQRYTVGEVQDPHAVRPVHHEVPGAHQRPQLGELGVRHPHGRDDGRAAAGVGQLDQGGHHGARRERHEGHVDAVRQLRDRRDGRQSVDQICRGVDDVHITGEPVPGQVGEELVATGRPLGGRADDGDRLGTHQRVDASQRGLVGIHQQPPGGMCSGQCRTCTTSQQEAWALVMDS